MAAPATVNLRSVSSYAFGRNRLSIVTRAGDTVRLHQTKSGNFNHIGYAATPRISGAGNFVLDNLRGEANLEGALAHSGRTILASGHLYLTNGVDGEVEFSGSLPSAAIIELSQDGGLHLNGVDQTIGGLTGYDDTEGEVYLDDATLTINSVNDTIFGGSLSGAGKLEKTGSATFTLSGDYLNAAGRVLSVKAGLLAVEGTLNLTAGSFELAGGRVVAEELSGDGSDWKITLSEADRGTPLVDIEGEADLTDAVLEINIAADVLYRPKSTFILLRADALTGVVPGGALFQYTDGEVLDIDGKLYRLALQGNEVRLNVLPGVTIFTIR